jgi:DNA-binding CsgD family transcriptional regulator
VSIAAAELTPRQQEVIRLLARGLTNKEIAGELGISAEGVKAHVSRLLLRAGVRNRVALVHNLMSVTAREGDDRSRSDAHAEMGRIADHLEERIRGEDGDFGGHREELRRLIGSLVLSAPTDVVRRLTELRESLAAIDLAVELAAKLPPDRSNDVLLGAIRTRARKALAASIALDEELSEALLTPATTSRRVRSTTEVRPRALQRSAPNQRRSRQS